MNGFIDFFLTKDWHERILLVALAALMLLMAWMVVESLLLYVVRAIHELTPTGRAQRQAREGALKAQVDAIMARIAGNHETFVGPPRPAATWLKWANRAGWILLAAWLMAWTWLSWHLHAQAIALRAAWVANEVNNPLWTPAFEDTTPSKLHFMSAFFALQVVCVLAGIGWQRHRSRRRRSTA